MPISQLKDVLPLFAANWSDLLGPVLLNDLSPKRLDPGTEVLSALVVGKGKAMSTLYNAFRRRAWDRLENLTQDEARKVLCISRGEFRSLAENDILAPMPWHTKSDRYRVKDVVHAVLRYVFVGRWCAINGIPKEKAFEVLTNKGFEPVCHSTFSKSPELVKALNRLKRETRPSGKKSL
ncbi:hypothetical protein [Candidatus Endoriftia persephonae]|jgi:hypothetical protein|uniref:Uncharacterized protein n=1 Tax=Candidatus Endoriftia persephonae TaxID=393765 RepID=A0A9J7A1Z7_9GAMM|nr:hypothetical protein [Candidatus Endoriftia persephone]USF89142.1 hypothetical protein L0Y14_07910 [Candidatus Endoriftia persephone]